MSVVAFTEARGHGARGNSAQGQSSGGRGGYVRKTARPIPQTRKNIIPPMSFLAYNWIDKDPDLDFVAWAIAESGKSAEWIEAQTEREGHKVSRYTIINWLYGGVKRPQNASMNMVMGVLGWDRVWNRAAH